MKKILSVLTISLLVGCAAPVTEEIEGGVSDTIEVIDGQTQIIYTDEIEIKTQTQTQTKSVESKDLMIDPAEFPGGDAEMHEYIQKNIDYPKEAKDLDKEGTVMVQFIVNKDGSISNIQIAKSVHPYLDKEALQIVDGMPQWSPAKEDGEPVASMMRLPIKFELN